MRRFAAGLALALALSSTTIAAGASAPATESPDSTDASRYLGRWNYDLPDREHGINVAVLNCPPAEPDCQSPFPYVPPGTSTRLPQIGDIVFTQEDGTVVGRTDVGCTWTFADRGGSFELDPAPQYCFNPTIRSGYTITEWSVTFAGWRARESIVGISHHPSLFQDYDFVLENGRRTRVGKPDLVDTTRLFTGVWEYDSANPQTNVNTVLLASGAAGGGEPVYRTRPQTGRVTITSDRANAITAHTSDGCAWTFAVRGATARLDPAGQACQVPDGTMRARSWTIAADGRHQVSTIRGELEQDGVSENYVLSGGALTRQRPTPTAPGPR